jgi:hypothetical protein
LPKLSLACDGATHLILAATASSGLCGDQKFFDDLLFQAWRRGPVRCVVADAGYDSEANHRIARLDMGVRSIIPATIGRVPASDDRIRPAGAGTCAGCCGPNAHADAAGTPNAGKSKPSTA